MSSRNSENPFIQGEPWDFTRHDPSVPFLGFEEEEEEEEAGEEQDPDATPEERGDFLPSGEEATGEEAGEAATGEEGGEAATDEAATSEEGGEAAAKEESGDDATKDFIPRYRYNQVARKNKELEQRLQQLEQQQQPAQQPAPQQQPAQEAAEGGIEQIDTQLKEITSNIAEAVKEGDSTKVQELMTQQMDLQNQRYEHMLNERTQEQATMTQEEVAYDKEVERLEQNYPFLNQDNEDLYNEELASHVVLLRNAFEDQGYTPAQALQRAEQQAKPLIEMTQKQIEEMQKQQQQPAKDDPAQQRATQQKQKNAETAQKQPPAQETGKNSDQAGSGGEKYDPVNMTEEEFDALPDSVIARMRGDQPA